MRQQISERLCGLFTLSNIFPELEADILTEELIQKYEKEHFLTYSFNEVLQQINSEIRATPLIHSSYVEKTLEWQDLYDILTHMQNVLNSVAKLPMIVLYKIHDRNSITHSIGLILTESNTIKLDSLKDKPETLDNIKLMDFLTNTYIIGIWIFLDKLGNTHLIT